MPVDQQRDERGTVDRTGTIARRPVLRSLAWGGALGVPAVRVMSGRVRAAGEVSVEFRRCKVAFVSNVSAVESLTVYYADAEGDRCAEYGIQPTYNDQHHYRPVLVEYDSALDRTSVQLTEPRGSLVRVIAESGSDGRTARTNPTAACVPSGFNEEPTASFTAETSDGSVASVDTTATSGSIEVGVGDQVTFESTAADPDPYEHLHWEWDLDGNAGFETTGKTVTATYDEPGTLTVRHRVTDEFGAEDVASLDVDVVDSASWSLTAKLVPDDLDDFDWFGLPVALSDETLAVGAKFDEERGSFAGAAYVYDLGESPPNPTKFAPRGLDGGDQFGRSVAVSGQTVVVGSPFDDNVDNTVENSGAAYVYDLSGSSPTSRKLVPDRVGGWDRFGHSVAISGETVVVGSPFDDDAGTDAGAAYLYPSIESSPTKLVPDGLGDGDRFGSSVAVSGETAVVGSPLDDGKGAAYLYDLSASPPSPTKLAPGSLSAEDGFGSSVAVSGQTAVVGSPFDDDAGTGAGAVYVYELGERSPSPTKLVPDDLDGGDRFGISVAVSGETLVVGSTGDDDRGVGSGAAYAYDLSGSSPTPVKLAPDELDDSDAFGESVTVSSDTLVVGVRRDDDAGMDAGAAYVYRG